MYKQALFEKQNAEKAALLKQQENQVEAVEKASRRQSGPYAVFFKEAASLLLETVKLSEHLDDPGRGDTHLEALAEENARIYSELSEGKYSESFANPVVCVDLYGKATGQLLCFLYRKCRECYGYAFAGKRYRISSVLDLFLNIHASVEQGDTQSLKGHVRTFAKMEMQFGAETYALETFGGKNRRLTQIVLEADLSNPRYLYDMGIYVSEYELKTFEFIKKYPQDKINELAEVIVNAYIEGFKRDGKDISLRHRVRVVAVAGQERLTRRILEVLEASNLQGYIDQIESTAINNQYGYDHKFDMALYLDEEMLSLFKTLREAQCEQEKDNLADYSGILYVERFGEEPFTPKSNTARVVLEGDQQSLYQEMMRFSRILVEKHIPESERSFCIVAFPTPEIGDQFEAIFEDIANVNMLKSADYEPLQKKLTDALDRGHAVHVLGKGTNRTDIKVALNRLEDPDKQTNFVNCVADVNIPVGEVFTSPVLKGTNGKLHLETVYLDGFSYSDLELDFEDGYIASYTCSNFEDEEENKKYIQENLIFPHDTLPIGEFAIGTNTLAYVIAQKYQIIEKLPILIVEKMGPHFAIGDTCFSFAEDMKVYNAIDGKEIVAKDNEKSILRKEDVSKAYTNKHTDITLPYDGLSKIAVILDDNTEVDIIRDGRFVLEGTEALNLPFSE